MKTDTTFITNEGERNLRERFKVLIRDTRFFDALVGYFYTSGFYTVYESLENTERIRILIGISTSKQSVDLIQQSQSPLQGTFQFSHAEAKEEFATSVTREMEHSEDSRDVEQGVKKFSEWLRNGKLAIKAYPSQNIHAKLYIMTFVEGDKDVGRVITGSSNFTYSGLVDNLEFNVELKNIEDYTFALARFNELWTNAVDVKDEYLETIQNRTWLNDTITPYELYLKFLYEYFKEKINIDQDTAESLYQPEGFLDLKYQREAVIDARVKLEEYGGVFLSDVVGLGKTYISALLASQLDGRHLVIAPPVLLDEDSPGSWPNVFHDFKQAARYESLGKLDHLIRQGTEKYQNVFIDESHRFRTETTVTYAQLAQICRGKRVILVTATPLNNSPKDILGQIKLFQKARKSTIPNLPDLENFFSVLAARLKGLDRQSDGDEYIRIVKQNAGEIREQVLKYIMVRRTRSEIVKYFAEDLQKQGFKFPDVADPEPVFYQFNENEDRVFSKTMELIIKRFHYARYVPLLYLKENIKITQPEELAQTNMRKFMKTLLVKRLESSFFAFRNTLARFIKSYEQFLAELDRGNAYISKKYANKIFEFLENDDDEAIQKLIDEDKAQRFDAGDFEDDFRRDLESDLHTLQELDRLWKTVDRDPKLLTILDILERESTLKHSKLIIFTESRETADYLGNHLAGAYPGQVLVYTGSSSAATRQMVIQNFDRRAKQPRSDYRILVSTEVLSEGVNLHQSNVVINYDIPWNPTRLMQRVGRINRVDTEFDTIYTFTFFPTIQSNDAIKLKEAAQYKIQGFIEMLGNDARLLTEGEEIKSHDLFSRLTSKKTITGEDEGEETELKYLQIIRGIRDGEPDLFERIKRLPRKARTARKAGSAQNDLLTYFRKGKLQKFYLARNQSAEELDFLSAARQLEVDKATPRQPIPQDYYDLLEVNKKAFHSATTEELPQATMKGGRDAATFVLRVLKSNQVRHFQGYTEDDELYIRDVIRLIEEGGLPRQITKTLHKALTKETNPLKILGILKKNIPAEFLKETAAESAAQTSGPREVILSEYLLGE
ncbi:MAG: helicase-related protein [Dehalococcoidia bacterium]